MSLGGGVPVTSRPRHGGSPGRSPPSAPGCESRAALAPAAPGSSSGGRRPLAGSPQDSAVLGVTHVWPQWRGGASADPHAPTRAVLAGAPLRGRAGGGGCHPSDRLGEGGRLAEGSAVSVGLGWAGGVGLRNTPSPSTLQESHRSAGPPCLPSPPPLGARGPRRLPPRWPQGTLVRLDTAQGPASSLSGRVTSADPLISVLDPSHGFPDSFSKWAFDWDPPKPLHDHDVPPPSPPLPSPVPRHRWRPRRPPRTGSPRPGPAPRRPSFSLPPPCPDPP